MRDDRMLAASVYLVATLLVWSAISAVFHGVSLPVGYGVVSAICAAILGILAGPRLAAGLRQNRRWWPALRAGLWVMPVALLLGGWFYGVSRVGFGSGPGALADPVTLLALFVQSLDAFVATIPALVPLSLLAGWVLSRLVGAGQVRARADGGARR